MGLDSARARSTWVLGPGDSWIDRSTKGWRLLSLVACHGNMPYPEDLGLVAQHNVVTTKTMGSAGLVHSIWVPIPPFSPSRA